MKGNNIIFMVIVLIGFPLLFWAVGDFPRRTILKEVISIITLISFFMLIGQLFLTRGSRKLLKLPSMTKVKKYHNVFGYIFVGIMLLHPFLIILPRYFEAGVDPMAAFIKIITTFNSTGVILGIIAWSLMITIGTTSFFRNQLSMKYTSWRLLHGILSILFIIIASWHAIDLGRHTNIPMSVFIIFLSASGVIMLIKTYLTAPIDKKAR